MNAIKPDLSRPSVDNWNVKEIVGAHLLKTDFEHFSTNAENTMTITQKLQEFNDVYGTIRQMRKEYNHRVSRMGEERLLLCAYMKSLITEFNDLNRDLLPNEPSNEPTEAYAELLGHLEEEKNAWDATMAVSIRDHLSFPVMAFVQSFRTTKELMYKKKADNVHPMDCSKKREFIDQLKNTLSMHDSKYN